MNFTDLPRKHGAESQTHRALKRCAANLLAELGETKIKFEYKCFDVYGADLSVAVECGDMHVDKIFEALNAYSTLAVKELWNLSYPKPDIQNQNKTASRFRQQCLLIKFRFNPKPCIYIDACKPAFWCKSLRNCRQNGADCYIKREYAQTGCTHLNGLEVLKKNTRSSQQSSNL